MSRTDEPLALESDDALFKAVEANDIAAIQRLVHEGQSVNMRDDDGRTPLHHAAKAAQPRVSSLLLALGADAECRDASGERPFDTTNISEQKLHRIRQVYQRLKTHNFDRNDQIPRPLMAAAERLEQDGIVKITGFIAPDALERMRGDAKRCVADIEALLAQGKGVKQHYDEELHWCPNDRAFICNNAFKYSADLIEFCFNPALQTIVNLYLGQPSFVSRGVIVRYPPSQSSGQRAFSWHHDMEDKRLKIMVLLTDIGPDDQYMSYVAGSHLLFHPLEMFEQNSYPLDYCKAQLGEVHIINSIGKAGDVFLFDSNGSHRAVRKPEGAMRDAFFVEFATNQSQVWGGDIDASLIERLSDNRANPFHRMQTAEKKWDQPATRKMPGWVDTLHRYDTWIN